MSEELNFVQKARREKVDALIARGVAPFAYRFERSHQALEAIALLRDGLEEGPAVKVAGRLVALRPHGKVSIIL